MDCQRVVGSRLWRNVVQIALGAQTLFERTPKFGISQRAQSWSARKYQLRFNSIVLLEVVFALYNLCTLVFAASNGNWGIAAYSSVFCVGLALTCATSIKQSLAVRLAERSPAPTHAAAVPERTLSQI